VTEVLGVDWYRRGWVGVALGDGVRVLVDERLAALMARVPDAAVIGVDMPIGLTDGVREADRLARAFVGPRRASVFFAPPGAALDATSYAEANAALPPGRRIPQQAWALRHGIAEVADLAAERVIEVHPEASFRALRGDPVPHAKTTWNGQMLRRRLLAHAGVALPDELGAEGVVPPADVLDAAAVAWSARRYAAGTARSFPPDAAPGDRPVIWC
jgi:predicted RNase H-like nuclease